jgi:riboflavin biosynthesis pyrimidine reductase
MLDPFRPLFRQGTAGAASLPLPPSLQSLYGELSFPSPADRPYVISNFVSTLDGVVSLGIPGKSGGGEISGFNQHDRALMGLLRAATEAVVVGAGTLRAVTGHVWTAEHVFPELRAAFQALRFGLGYGPTPLNVILSRSGQLDLSSPVFASGQVRVLVVTTRAGAASLGALPLPASVTVRVATETHDGRVTAGAVLAEVSECLGNTAPRVLLEGGPRVMGDFFAEQRIDELFLTLAPQVVGRADDGLAERPGLVAGRLLAPAQPAWATLSSVHQADNHLFLRYHFARVAEQAAYG